MTLKKRLPLLAAVLLSVATAACAQQEATNYITVASTDAAQDSGLLNAILPVYTQSSGIEVRYDGIGPNDAIEAAKQGGDIDALFVDDVDRLQAFVNHSDADQLFNVMYDNFVIVGPASDPAGIAGKGATAALQAIAAKGARFIGPADDSGGDIMARQLWQDAGVTPAGAWYSKSTKTTGPTLDDAAQQEAYTLVELPAWLPFAHKGNLQVLVQGDPALRNQYGVALLNPNKFSDVKGEEAQTFIEWLVSPEGQGAIGSFRVNGQQVFFPNAGAE